MEWIKMKLCWLVLLVGGLVCCRVPADSPKMVEEIVKDGTYRIEYAYQGCFGGDTELLEISRKKGSREATYTYTEGRADGAHEQTRTIPWNKEKDELVEKLFNKGMAVEDTVGLCTTHATFSLVSSSGRVRFNDNDCAFMQGYETLKQ